MASKTSTTQLFTIALAVFVTLTLVLAGTTYWFYKEYDKAQDIADAKQKEASEKNSAMLKAENERKLLLTDVLGFDKETSNEDVMKAKQDDIDDAFGKELAAAEKDLTYSDAVEWLSEAIKNHAGRMAGLQNKEDEFAKQRDDLEAKHVAEMDVKNASLTKIEEEKKKLETAKVDAERAKKDAEEKLEKVTEEFTGRLEQAVNLRAKIAKLESDALLSAASRKKWPKLPPEKKPDAEEAGKNPEEDPKTPVDFKQQMDRLELVRKEFEDVQKENRELRVVLDKLRVADESLQRTVRAAIPRDERIDSFDGRILSVNELDRTVLVSCGVTTGLRAGLMFDVYDPVDPQPLIGTRKGVVEVVAIESDSLVRCRVRQDSTRDPIIPGDVVATALWSPGTALEVVVVGMPDFGGKPDADRLKFEQMVQRLGGTVEEEVTPTTTVIVDAGFPKVSGVGADGQDARKQLSKEEKERRKIQIDEARRLGIKVVALEPFLAMMGLRTESVRENRLPVPAAAR